MPRFKLEGPRPCTIFCFYAHVICMSYVRNQHVFFLLCPQFGVNTYGFVQGQGQKTEQ